MKSWRSESKKRMLVLFKLEGLNQLNKMVGRDLAICLLPNLVKQLMTK